MKNKIIYIFSAERWGIMKVSKHHYAIELSRRNNVIYFLESAVKSLKQSVVVEEVANNIKVVNYPFIARGRNFFPKILYNYLLKLEVKKMIKGIGVSPDIVWNFDPQRLNRVPFFKKALKIFHAVDFYNRDLLPNGEKLDISFSTITKEVHELKRRNYKSFFLNHGLSEHFIPFATRRLQEINHTLSINTNKIINVGYVGNLISGIPDMATMKEVVQQNTTVNFHFWGQFEKHNSTLGFYNVPMVFDFIEFLKQQPHVKLYGAVDTSVLAKEIQNMDMFWICWHTDENTMWNQYTNPHKIIEYLSTGKPVVAHYIDTYKNNDLIYLSISKSNNEDYPSLFKKVINIVRDGESFVKEKERIEYALDNSYKKQIERIEEIITANVHEN